MTLEDSFAYLSVGHPDEPHSWVFHIEGTAVGSPQANLVFGKICDAIDAEANGKSLQTTIRKASAMTDRLRELVSLELRRLDA